MQDLGGDRGGNLFATRHRKRSSRTILPRPYLPDRPGRGGVGAEAAHASATDPGRGASMRKARTAAALIAFLCLTGSAWRSSSGRSLIPRAPSRARRPRRSRGRFASSAADLVGLAHARPLRRGEGSLSICRRKDGPIPQVLDFARHCPSLTSRKSEVRVPPRPPEAPHSASGQARAPMARRSAAPGSMPAASGFLPHLPWRSWLHAGSRERGLQQKHSEGSAGDQGVTSTDTEFDTILTPAAWTSTRNAAHSSELSVLRSAATSVSMSG